MEYLRELQLTELEILNEIHRICSENGLSYFLIGGTLLGAIRHNGFIPWDDDLDIAMPRAEYNRFLDLCETELNDNFYLHSIKTDKEYWLPFSKIRKKYTLFDEENIAELDVPKGIFVDIFPLDEEFSETSFEKKFRTKIIKSINVLIISKKGLRKNDIIGKIAVFFAFPFSIEKLQKFQIRLMSKNSGRGGAFYTNYGSNYDSVRQTMPKSVYEPASLVEFEKNSYFAPKDYEYVLTRIFGKNYAELPPEEKRRTHKPLRISFDTRKGES